MGSKAASAADLGKKMGSRRGVGHTERMGTRNRQVRRGIGSSERMSRRILGEPATSAASANVTVEEHRKKLGMSLAPTLDANGHMTPEAVEMRISKSVRAQQVVLRDGGGGKKGEVEQSTRLEYAYVTQRGYYPDDLHKANQDRFTITTDFAGVDGDMLFAVYDGHGRSGHDCAQFAKEKYPKILAKHVRQARIKRHKSNMAREAKKAKQMAEGGNEVAKKKTQKGAFNPKLWPMLTTTQYEEAIQKAHVECNRAMHNADKVDDALSGTTLVSCVFHDGNMIVTNCGDSRAVLGYNVEKGMTPPSQSAGEEENGKEEENGADGEGKEEEKEDVEGEMTASKERDAKNRALHQAYSNLADVAGADGEGGSNHTLAALPLTRDHTPFREDERDRVKKAGGRVLTVDMLEGLEPVHENFGQFRAGEDIDEIGDPPRVWMKDADFPGTAFTRSLGDAVGEEIGVTPTPEIVSRRITKNDRIMVVASDGVFEFIPNRTVIDICADCHDPLEACRNLVQESYRKWLHYELRTDDITAIVIFLQCQKESDDEAADVRQMLEISTAQGQKPMKPSSASPQSNRAPKDIESSDDAGAAAAAAVAESAEEADAKAEPGTLLDADADDDAGDDADDAPDKEAADQESDAKAEPATPPDTDADGDADADDAAAAPESDADGGVATTPEGEPSAAAAASAAPLVNAEVDADGDAVEITRNPMAFE